MTRDQVTAIDRSRRGWMLASVAAVLLVGGWLRLAQLGALSLDFDEFLHAMPAQAMLEGRGPELPSGQPYTRALPYTKLVAGSFRLFGVSEASARLPSVALGMLVILITYLLGRRWLGAWPAVMAAGLVATAPILVETSRVSRMYPLFQLLFLCGLAAYFIGWEEPRRWRSRLAWSVAALALLAASFRIHYLTVDAAPGLLAYWALMAAMRRRRHHVVFLALTIAIAGLGIATGLLDPMALWKRMNSAPAFAQGLRYAHGYYAMNLADGQPWIWWAMPFAVVWAVVHLKEFGVFLVCVGLAPLALHSLVFDWKAMRFVSPLYPWLALLLAPWLVRLIASAGRLAQRLASRAAPAAARPAGMIAVVALVAVLVGRATFRSLALQQDPWRLPWRAAYQLVDDHAQPGDALLVSVPLTAQYYARHAPTHGLSAFDLRSGRRMPPSPEGWPRDWYSGLPVITTLDSLLAVQSQYARGWVVIDRYRIERPAALASDIRNRLLQSTVPLPFDDPKLLLFYWTPDTTGRKARLDADETPSARIDTP